MVCVKMFKLLEQLQLFDSDTISAKQVWMDIKIMLRKAIDDLQSPVRQRTRHTDLLYAEAISAKQCPMSLLEDMLDTLVMTAQEEDFERGNSSKDGRADDSDDDDYDKSSRKKRRRPRKHRGTRRERNTELAQVTSGEGNFKVREADIKMVKKMSEMKGKPCSKCEEYGPLCFTHGYIKYGKVDKAKQDAVWKEFKSMLRKAKDDTAQVAKIDEVESEEETAGSELMDQVALLGEESESEYSNDDSDEEGYDSSARDYRDKWFHPDNIGKNGVMNSKSSKTTKVVRPTNYLNEFQRNARYGDDVHHCCLSHNQSRKLTSPKCQQCS